MFPCQQLCRSAGARYYAAPINTIYLIIILTELPGSEGGDRVANQSIVRCTSSRNMLLVLKTIIAGMLLHVYRKKMRTELFRLVYLVMFNYKHPLQ